MRRWLALLVLVALLGGCGQPPLVGTDLGTDPAPDFELTDQAGETVALTDLRGHVVVLTFVYSTCPDICVLTASKLRAVQDTLGDDARRLKLVAVSVDPERDTVEQLARYTSEMGMDGRWHFLTGARGELGRVWAAYGIAVLPGPGGTVGHTDAVFLIDPEGRRRLLMRSDFEQADMASNIRGLLRGS